MTTPAEAVSRVAGPGSKPRVRQLSGQPPIAYVEAGPADGETLLLVHGSLCDLRYWRPQLLGLSETLRVVAPSLSHYHPHLPVPDDRPPSWRTHVDQLGTFVDTLGPRKLHLAGHSRGANVAFQLALRRPERLASLMLIDPGGRHERDGGDPEALARLDALRRRASQQIDAGELDAGLESFIDSTTGPGFWARSDAIFKTMARDNACTLSRQLANPMPLYRSDDARRIACPTLLMHGERSPGVYRRNVAYLADEVVRTSCVRMERASHGMSWTHPQAFNRHLLAFLRSVSVGAPA